MVKQSRDTKQSSFHKAIILSFIKEQGDKTITELANYLEVTRPTIYGHLEILEKRGLIKRSKDNSKKGAPVKISLTSKSKPVSLSFLNSTKTAWDKIISASGAIYIKPEATSEAKPINKN